MSHLGSVSEPNAPAEKARLKLPEQEQRSVAVGVIRIKK